MINNFKQLSKSDVQEAGGKGASLGEMTQAGISVPPGFVILSSAFERFIEETDLIQEIDSILHKVNHKQMHTIENASETIKALILESEMPKDISEDINKHFKELGSKYVAVRSSATAEDGATAAWAGQLESYLNTTEENLLQKVKHCWASLFTPRAIFYRFEKGLHETKISVAVVVQKMVDSEVSGIAFSVHPVTEDRNQLIIEAGFGLGEAIVSGSVTPDSYVVEKEPSNILDINISTQNRGLYRVEGGGNEWKDIAEPQASSQVLTREQILELSELILRIENHYGFPCDIEWAYEEGKFYIVQSRPITTLSGAVSKSDFIDFSEWEYEFQQRNKHPILAAEMWLRALSSTFKTEINLAVPDRIDYIFTSDYKGWVKKSAKKQIVNEIKKQDFAYLNYISQNIQKRIEELDQIKEKILSIYSESTLEELAELWKEFDRIFVNFIPWYYIPWYVTEEDILIDKLLEALKPHREKLDKIAPIQEILGILTFPKKKAGFQKASEELEKIINIAKTNGLDSKMVDKAVEHYQNDFGYLSTFLFLDISPRSRGDIKNEVSNRLAEVPSATEKKSVLIDEIIAVIKDDKEALNLVEFSQEYSWLLTSSVEDSFKIFSDLQPFFRHIALTINVPYADFAHYTSEEIINGLVNKVMPSSEEIEQRKTGTLLKCENGQMVKVFGEEANAISRLIEGKIQGKAGVEDGVIQGKSAFGGLVQGKVKVCLSAQDASKIEPGDILVTSMTTPDFVPVMKLAGAIVTDEGGLLCHAAIISRELKKPCIINTKIATQVLKDGDLIEVSADTGLVKFIESVSKKIDFNKYVRLFKVTGLKYLISDIFTQHYKTLDVLLTYANQTWTTYLPQTVINRTLDEGVSLFGNETKFNNYKKEFADYIKTSEKFFKELLKKNELSKDETAKFFELAGRFFYYYSKTEFFYTDKAFTESPNNPVLTQNLKELEGIKNKGRETMNKFFFGDRGYMLEVLSILGKQFRLKPDKIAEVYSISDILDLFEKESIIENNDRSLAFIMVGNGNTFSVTVGTEANELISTSAHSLLEKSGHIKGVSAHRGKVKGSVKIIPADYYTDTKKLHRYLSEMKEGQILVAETTSPELMPACKKASAIVTDQGGLLSHAAIVSRELNIPCIVGTGNATERLHDGDMIEVDADKGSVKILQESVNTNIISRFESSLKGGEMEKWEGNFSLLLLGTGIGGCLKPLSKKYDFNFGYWIFCVEGKHGMCFCDRSKYVETTTSAYKKFIDKGNQIQEIKDFEELWKQAVSLYVSNTPAVLKKLKGGQLENLIKKSFKIGRGLIGSTVFSESLDETQIKNHYQQIQGKGTFEEFFAHASKPAFNSFALRADNNILKDPNSTELQYILCDYYLPPQITEVSKKIRDLISDKGGLEKIRAEADNIQAEIVENKKAVDGFRSSLNKKQAILFDFAQTCMYIRDVRKDPLQKILSVISNSVMEYFDRKNIPTEDAAFALYSDFDSGLYKSPEYFKEIAKRKEQGVTVFFSDDEVIFEYGNIKERTQGLFKAMTKDSASELSGSVAYPGNVKGVVKIILNENDFSKFNKGEILVTSMTRPEFVPLMKKSSAVITDEGGITCHAAIISRELKIPCIIGTKIATRILKDGDIIEVDANNGIVKIIT